MAGSQILEVRINLCKFFLKDLGTLKKILGFCLCNFFSKTLGTYCKCFAMDGLGSVLLIIVTIFHQENRIIKENNLKKKRDEEEIRNLDLVPLSRVLSLLIEVGDVTETTSTVLHDRHRRPPPLPRFQRRILRIHLEIP